MPKICRSDSWVREVCFTGRTFSGREAFHNGFISELVGETLSFDKSVEIAKMIASNEASAVLGTKHHLNVSSRKGIHSAFDKVAFWNSIKLQDTESVTRAVRKIFKSKL
jgi:delta(3,5)-delta(2,4)-dienoyl-CoA isomerase